MLYKLLFKRFLDFLISLIAFLILSPIFITIVILLLFFNEGKPFFFQKRPGKNNKIFTIFKFKTMNDRKDESGNLLPDSIRLTPVGKFIRKTSLDEIPQLMNVLIGDMSLVGPRPLLPEYLEHYTPMQARRHLVRPGITGWAQVNGRNLISWEKKFEYDVWYVDNLSFSLDIKILFKTLFKAFKREGINAQNVATVEKFTGSAGNTP